MKSVFIRFSSTAFAFFLLFSCVVWKIAVESWNLLSWRGLFYHARQPPVQKNKANEIEQPPHPCVSFSGGGMAWSYFVGVVVFLQDNFDLKNVRFAGISAGFAAAFSLYFDLTVVQSFQFGLAWAKLFRSRWLYCFFMSGKDVQNMLKKTMSELGLTEQTLENLKRTKGKNLAAGVSKMTREYPFLHSHVYDDFSNIEELVRAATCSMRILPFFRDVEKYDGHYSLDGGLTAMYAESNAVRIAPIRIPDKYLTESQTSDVSPKHHIPTHKFIVNSTIDGHCELFRRGYEDAAQVVDVFVKKGLKLSRPMESLLNKSRDDWKNHVKKKIDEAVTLVQNHFS